MNPKSLLNEDVPTADAFVTGEPDAMMQEGSDEVEYPVDLIEEDEYAIY